MSKKLNIGLDVDGLLSCFACGVLTKARQLNMVNHFPKTCRDITYWGMSDQFSKVMKDAWRDEQFWLDLPRLYPTKLKFTPACYITSRLIPSRVTEQWLKTNDFPDAEVVTVSKPADKLKEIKKRNVDVFVDDYYVTIQQLIDNGITAYLYKAPYQVGHIEECKHLPTIDTLEIFND